jgi:cephalosporin-C deacetylase-like acetyl esterase
MTVPADFATYWDELDRDLARYPPAPELEQLPLRSTDFANVYALRLTSIGPYRIFAYLSVPTGVGPFAAVIQMPRYGSVNHVPAYELRERYAVMTIIHRGQRLADEPFAAEYPGLLTLGIDDPVRFTYRGIVADCMRGAEYMLNHSAVDSNRIALIGDDLAIITAARRPHISVVQAADLMLYRLLEAASRTQTYPIEEVNDWLRTYPEQRDAIARTLAYFDPTSHAPQVMARTLLNADDPGDVGGPEWLQPLAQALAGPVELYQLTHEGRTDHDWQDAWLADQLLTG